MHSLLAKPLSMLLQRIEGDTRWDYVPLVEKVCHFSKNEVLKDQWDRLLHIIHFAYAKIPFYRDRFSEAGIRPETIQSPSDLLRIPILVREDIRRNQTPLLNPSLDEKQLVGAATGGTTDSPIHLFLDKECLCQRRAATHVFYTWFGYRPGDSMAFLWGAQQDFPRTLTFKNKVRQWLLGRSLFLPCSYLNDDIMWGYYKRLSAFQPKVLQAYPTALYLFADFLERNGLRLPIKSINVAAEYLYGYQREKIESVFQTRIFNWYGARELGHIATECEMHRGMHINTFGVYVEILKDGRQVEDEMGEIVITDLLNKAMPLIRYKIGDVGSISQRNCPCGSSLPFIEEVGGRYVDTFKKRDGTFIPTVAFTGRVIKEHLGIEKLQIIQKDFEHLQLNIMKGEQYSDRALANLEEELCQFMRERLSFDVRFVDEILPEKSGKMLFCKSEVTPPDPPRSRAV